MALRSGAGVVESSVSFDATALTSSAAQPRQLQLWQRYGRFIVNWRRKRSKNPRVFDRNTRVEPQAGHVVIPPPSQSRTVTCSPPRGPSANLTTPSATTSPFTRATPYSTPIRARNRLTVAVKMTWSPACTGLRNFM